MGNIFATKSHDDMTGAAHASISATMSRSLRLLSDTTLDDRSKRQARYIEVGIDDSSSFRFDRSAHEAELARRNLVKRGLLNHG